MLTTRCPRPPGCCAPTAAAPRRACAAPSSPTTTPPGMSTRCSRWPRSTPGITAELGPLSWAADWARRRDQPPVAGWLDGGMPDYDAFLLVSFGGPEGPGDVMPFLENVTRGRGVPRERLAAVAEHYYAA